MKQIAIVHEILPVEEVRSNISDQTWLKQIIVFRYTDSDNCFAPEFFGERRIENLKQLKRDMLVEVTYSITARPYNDKWINQVNGYGVRPMAALDKEGKPLASYVVSEQKSDVEPEQAGE